MELRPLREADVASLVAWLPGCAAAAGCDRWAGERAIRAALRSEGARLGREGTAQSFVAYEIGAPQRDAAHVSLLAVPPEHRRLGLGSRTALALERRLRRSVARVYVLVPAGLGLALYFWLRLGYRPLTQRDWPAQPEQPPAVWMVRELR